MIFGDLETTGLLRADANALRNQPYITEMYFVKLNWSDEHKAFEFISEFETFVRPPVPIPEEITRITGIDDAMLAGAPKFPSIYPDLYEFFRGENTFVAHNVAFEIGVLKCELMRIGCEYKFPWAMNQICTIEHSMQLQHKRMKLAALYEHYYGTPPVTSHRARADVETLVSCFIPMRKDGLV